jgi:septal ring factor EnvC (AmiA/AmiB activator)
MIFFWLVLVALVFGVLGFLMHAFYFNRQERVENLEKEIESMTRVLARRDRAKTEAEQQSAAAASRIKVLELKLTEEKEQRSALEARLRQQEDEIRELRLVASRDLIKAAEIVEQKNERSEMGQPMQAEVAGSGRKTPLWKDNLNNILSMLDKFEKKGGD